MNKYNKFDFYWESSDNPFRHKITKAQFKDAWREFSSTFGAKKENFIKWLLTEKFPGIFTVGEDNQKMIRKRDQEDLEIYSVQSYFANLLEKRQTPSQKEAKERKDRWEHGVKGLAERQRRLVETGGLKDHIIGSKHEISRLGADEERKLPKSMPRHPRGSTSEKYMAVERESYARELISQPDPVRAGQWNKAMVLGINTDAISEARRKLGKRR